jgi:hypothetical protein
MNIFEIKADSKKLFKHMKDIEDLFIKKDLVNKDVFIISLWFAVKASDVFGMSKKTFLLNAENFWDQDSEYSSEENKENLQ